AVRRQARSECELLLQRRLVRQSGRAPAAALVSPDQCLVDLELGRRSVAGFAVGTQPLQRILRRLPERASQWRLLSVWFPAHVWHNGRAAFLAGELAMSHIEEIEVGWSWDDDFPLAQGVRVGDTVYLAGQVAVDPQGRVVGPNDLTAQSRQIFENMRI